MRFRWTEPGGVDGGGGSSIEGGGGEMRFSAQPVHFQKNKQHVFLLGIFSSLSSQRRLYTNASLFIQRGGRLTGSTGGRGGGENCLLGGGEGIVTGCTTTRCHTMSRQSPKRPISNTKRKKDGCIVSRD